MPLYRIIDRQTAEREIRMNPRQPILRPCRYTARYPSVLTVTYMNKGTIQHSLIDRCKRTGHYYGVNINPLGRPERSNVPGFSSGAVLDRLLGEMSEPEFQDDPVTVTECNEDPVAIVE